MVLDFTFTQGKYNGITLSALGQNKMPIVGGSGVFWFARGFAQTRTYSNSQTHSIVEYNSLDQVFKLD
ncbi:hypothetical protein SCA6_002395 [Theobroma cacao]